MAEEVYVVTQMRPKDARWELSEEEAESLMEKIGKARSGAGGREVAVIRTYSSEWRFIRVAVYPEMEAYHKLAVATGPERLNIRRYFDFDITLGFDSSQWDSSANK